MARQKREPAITSFGGYFEGYSYRGTMERLNPSIGNIYHYAAKVTEVTRNDRPVGAPTMHEHWGETKEIAEEKAAREVQDWVQGLRSAKQNGKGD
jgi:hypothetical protein